MSLPDNSAAQFLEPPPKAEKPLIRVFPDSIFTVDNDGNVSMIKKSPRSPVAHALRWGWLVVALAFLISVVRGYLEFSVLLFSLTMFYPLIAVIIANLIFPTTEYQAHFDSEGLHLAIGNAQDPTAEASIFCALSWNHGVSAP